MWTWRFQDSAGTEAPPAVAPEEFDTQADAEAWVGEVWQELRDGGTERVVLYQEGVEDYAMSLLAAEA
ncbi:hypothetical protein AB0M43_11145 [Longispora sp. NPDC051575]|uniref:hypothetical protein n=1 Tax=Longispora sp. NPDC051575 TaxID=3154943 RepID=UPI003436FF99